MPVYERRTVVDAPLEDVWDFHLRPAGLAAVTPDWLHLRVEAVEGPDGDTDPGRLAAGSRIESSVRPFGVGPRRRWTSSVATARRDGAEALFRDEMVRGPVPRWEHTHRFESVPGGTRLHDRVAYRLPGGPLGRLAGPLAVAGLEPLFRYRHGRTKELLE